VPPTEGHTLALFDVPLAELLDYRPERVEPDDFDAFWRAMLSDAAQHELKPECIPYDALLLMVRAQDARFNG
jgi:cephalosporin-C deacetylase